MSVYEYNPSDRSSWRVHQPPAFPHWFQDGLNRIGGMNRHGKPNLRLVWGGTALSEKSADKGRLKYLCGRSPKKLKGYEYNDENGVRQFVEDINDAPRTAFTIPVMESQQLGLLRWVIEIWTSPESLEAAQRFRNRYLPGEISPILRKFPREGIYDTFFIVENLQEKFRPVDHDVLQVIAAMWKDRQRSFAEREADEQAYEDREAERKAKVEAELDRALLQGDLKLDPEEKERRAEYWAKHDYSQDSVGTFM